MASRTRHTYPKEQWPASPHATSLVNDNALSEIAKARPTVAHSLASVSDVPPANKRIGLVMDCSNYSSVTRLLRVTAHVLRFIRRLRRQVTNDVSGQLLNARDPKEAEILWIIEIQSTSFPEVRRLLNSKERVNNQLICQLSLFCDKDNVIRCEGRLEHSTLSTEENNPILLASKHDFTTSIIKDGYQNVHHGGTNAMLNYIRSSYWVLRGR